MNDLNGKLRCIHIRAFAWSVVVVVAALSLSMPVLRVIEDSMMEHLLALPFPEKNQGLFLQRQAFHRSNVLPLYGSSELTEEMEFRADEMFWNRPKGFQVCPVGAGGNTTLLMAEKIAALGGAVRDQKVVVILSPVWFRDRRPRADQVAGNFSPLQVINLMLSPDLDDGLRKRFAERMLRFPDSLEPHPLIRDYLKKLKRDDSQEGWNNRLLRLRLWGYEKMLAWEDHLNTVLAAYEYGINDRGSWKHKPKKLALSKRIKRIERDENKALKLQIKQQALEAEGEDDGGESLAAMAASEEWGDYQLLLDALKNLKAKALVVSIPMPGEFSAGRKISRAERTYYYQRVEAMSTERGYPVVTFADHDLDTDFIVGNTSHPAAKGWLYINRLLDEFYHDDLIWRP